MKTEICRLYSSVFWIFLPNLIKIDPSYRPTVWRLGHFLRHSLICDYDIRLVFAWTVCAREYMVSDMPCNVSVCLSVTVCGSGEWTCFNRQCLTSRLQLCNGVNDCSDGSDESYAHARCPGHCHITTTQVFECRWLCGALPNGPH